MKQKSLILFWDIRCSFRIKKEKRISQCEATPREFVARPIVLHSTMTAANFFVPLDLFCTSNAALTLFLRHSVYIYIYSFFKFTYVDIYYIFFRKYIFYISCRYAYFVQILRNGNNKKLHVFYFIFSAIFKKFF